MADGARWGEMLSLRYHASWFLWPALLLTALAGTAVGIGTGHDVLAFNAVYLIFAVPIGILERVMPHERAWLIDDRQPSSG